MENTQYSDAKSIKFPWKYYWNIIETRKITDILNVLVSWENSQVNYRDIRSNTWLYIDALDRLQPL